MKNSLLIIALNFFAAACIAQPIFNGTDLNPVLGDHFVVNPYIVPQGTSINTGSAGDGQVWDLSVLGSLATWGPNIINVVVPASSGMASTFPDANVAFASMVPLNFYNISPSAWMDVGSFLTNLAAPATNAMEILHFPVAYNSTFTDAFRFSYLDIDPHYRSGDITSTIDGQGTLTTPAGTFYNVLRQHSTKNITDSNFAGGNLYVSILQEEVFNWYLKDNHIAIATVTHYISNNGDSYQASYLTNVLTGMKETNLIKSFTLSPNPASSCVNLDIEASVNSKVELKIYNLQGAFVKSIREPFIQGNHYTLDISDLSKSIYFLELQADDKTFDIRKLVIAQ